jgi:molybdate transport system substrate-binding protein
LSLPLSTWLASGVDKFVIPNPDHAPYGTKAREVLHSLGLWSSLQSRLVVGDNAAQAGQFVFGGHVKAGLLPLSLFKAHALPAHLQAVPVPTSLHSPLIQRMVLLKNAESGAQAFYDFMLSEPAKTILKQHGFDTAVNGM